jgi:hypothetical protein
VADLLGDKEWAKEIFEKAYNKIDETYDAISLAEYVYSEDHLNDSEFAKRAYQKALDVVECPSDYVSVAESVSHIDYLEDKEWSKLIYTKALDEANSVDEKLDIASSIANIDTIKDRDWAKEILKECEDKVKFEDKSRLVDILYDEYGLNDRLWADRVFEELIDSSDDIDSLEYISGNIMYNKRLGHTLVIKAIKLIEDDEQKDEWADIVEYNLDDEEWAKAIRESSVDNIAVLSNEYIPSDGEDSDGSSLYTYQVAGIFFTLALIKWIREDKELDNIVTYRIVRDYLADTIGFRHMVHFEEINNKALTYAITAKKEKSFSEFVEFMLSDEEYEDNRSLEYSYQYIEVFKRFITEEEDNSIAIVYKLVIDDVINNYLKVDKDEKKVNELYMKLYSSQSYLSYKEVEEADKRREDKELTLKRLHDLLGSVYMMEENGTIHEDRANDIYNHTFKYIYREMGGKEACSEYIGDYEIDDFGDNELIEEMFYQSSEQDKILENIKIIINTNVHAPKYINYNEMLEMSGLPISEVDDEESILELVEEDGDIIANYPNFWNNRNVMMKAIQNTYKNVIEYASDELKDNKEFLIGAMLYNTGAFEYASDDLKCDKSLAIIAVRHTPSNAQYICEELMSDMDIAKLTVQSTYYLDYIDESLFAEDELIEEMIKNIYHDYKSAEDALEDNHRITNYIDEDRFKSLWNAYTPDLSEIIDDIRNLDKELKDYPMYKDNMMMLNAINADTIDSGILDQFGDVLKACDELKARVIYTLIYDMEYSSVEEAYEEWIIGDYIDIEEIEDAWENYQSHYETIVKDIWSTLEPKLDGSQNPWNLLEESVSEYYYNMTKIARNTLISGFLHQNMDDEDISEYEYFYLLVLAILAKSHGNYIELIEKSEGKLEKIEKYIRKNKDRLYKAINLEEI